jgi:carboxymethylenebutenolidase
LINEIGLDADAVMKLGAEPRWTERRVADTQAALARGVFGAPGYVIGDEIFWGQDRLDFVDRKLARG